MAWLTLPNRRASMRSCIQAARSGSRLTWTRTRGPLLLRGLPGMFVSGRHPSRSRRSTKARSTAWLMLL